MKKLLSTILAICMLAAGNIPAYADAAPETENAPQTTAGDEYVRGTLLFALKNTDSLSALLGDFETLGLTDIEPLFTENGEAIGFGTRGEIWYRADVNGDVTVAVEAVSALDGVVCAEPEYIYTSGSYGEPSEIECEKNWTHDKFYKQNGKHWWKENEKHDYAPGDGTIVAVIDTGVDYTHEDLKANMWVNYAELDGTAGVDDDGNGYIDDIHGVNVTAKKAAVGNPMDDNGHGTHVAGIIAMSANKTGGVGLAYGAKVMAIKAGQSTGTFASSDIAKSINYAVMMGADVINMSFGGTGKSYLIESALEAAFATCVLVASAGNDGLPTTDADPAFYPKRADLYPAGYSYVLGVMATDEDDNLASFSNWDYTPNANCEYEMTAPGVGIYSALPGNRYAVWNGTSMAAPFVSAAAAIIRSHYQDKDMYSSRFIMGQLSSATEDRTEFEAPMGEYYLYPALNVYDSIANLPKPNITVKETFLMDNDGGDGDAIIEAGETIDMGVLVRNQWGLTGEITVKADALSIAGVENPYIEFITDEIVLEPAGTFQEVDNGFVYDDSYLEDVDNPIRFTVTEDCPNDAEICINLIVTTTNGADENDDAEYTAESEYTFRVQAGKGVQGTIDEDTTWTNDYLWIVENSIYIPEGVTLTVEPGTQVQFHSSDYEDAYGGMTMPLINNDGTLNMIGTEDEPIELFTGKGYEDYVVQIYGKGTETLKYCVIVNPMFADKASSGNSAASIDMVDQCILRQNYMEIYHRELDHTGVIKNYHYFANGYVKKLTNTQMYDLDFAYGSNTSTLFVNKIENCLFDSCRLKIEETGNTFTSQNNVFLGSHGDALTDFGDWYEYPNNAFTLKNISAIKTYDGSESKYVAVQFTNYITSAMYYKYLADIADSLGGTIACMNDADEEAFLRKNFSLWYVGYAVTDDGFMWDDGNTYIPTVTNISELDNISSPYAQIESTGITFRSSLSYGNCGLVLEVPADLEDEEIIAGIEDFNYEEWSTEIAEEQFTNNAIINPLLNNDPDTWARVKANSYNKNYIPHYAINNYWGTENDRLINKMIVDGNDFAGTYQEVIYDPILTLESESLADIYPFVTEIYIEDEDGNIVENVQPGNTYDVHVLFNRDMADDVPPTVTYGGEAPYTDYAVHGEFVSEREWVGTTTISPVMNSGTMYFKTVGGCAADDRWLVCGEDVLRFSFDVETVGVLAMLLSADGGTNKITLSWAQNDYDVLAGYNLYRSTSENSNFQKLNASVLTGTSYEDTDVEPGVMYYYYFKVVNTEGNEEENVSNTAGAKPIDNIAPVLTHSAIKKAKMNTQITVSANASDNIGVTDVTLYYRVKGTSKYKSVEMMNTSGTHYAATIPASSVTADGVEYYLTASDADGNTMHSGTEQLPNVIEVDSAPAITGVTPQLLSIAGGQIVTILGVNFSEDMTLLLGDTEISEFTLVNSGMITFTTPAMKSGRYVLVLTDIDGRTATAKEQIVCNDESSVAQIPTNMEMFSGTDYTIPFIATADSAVTSLHFELDLPSAYFQNIRVEKAEEDANFTLDYNYKNGILQVSCIGTDNIITQNTLVHVIVTPRTTEKLDQSIDMHDVRFNGADVYRVISGTAQLNPVFRIDVEVHNWSDSNSPMEGAVIRADGQTVVTDENGQAVLDVVNKQVDITASGTTEVPSGTISAYDASLVLQYSVDKVDLNEYQLIAADVTGDGRIDESDASSILQMAVRKISVFPCGIRWSFAPASISKELNTSSNSVTFTAICIGDVDGSIGEE